MGGSRGGAKGAEGPPKFFRIRFLIDGFRHSNVQRGALFGLPLNKPFLEGYGRKY